jgi:hypothetical protein
MGTKLYLKARKLRIPPIVARTRDFDFVFSVGKKLSEREGQLRAQVMHTIMSRYVNGFVAWLNRTYVRTNARIVVSTYLPPERYLPATKQYLYRVFQYRIQFPGQDPVDFVDSTLAYIPGASRADLNLVYSRLYGLPIPTGKKLFETQVAVAAGAFLYPGVKQRNPIYGRRKEKGQKNIARLHELHKIAPRKNTLIQNFIRRVRMKNVKRAKQNANKIIKEIQK